MLLLCKREIDKSHHYHEATVGFITAAMNGFFALHHIMRNATTNKLLCPMIVIGCIDVLRQLKQHYDN